jgi:hypothetical protein
LWLSVDQRLPDNYPYVPIGPKNHNCSSVIDQDIGLGQKQGDTFMQRFEIEMFSELL